jgi:RNA polymerase sigma-70 factor (ECF subfamily)
MNLNGMNDEKLHKIIVDCQNNSCSAQEKLYHLFSSKFFGICLRYAANYAEAEDMLQEGFIKLYQKIDKYNFSDSFPAWASRLFSNNCIDQLRKRPNLYTLSESKAYTLESDTIHAIHNLYLEDLVVLIQELPIGYRTVFNLYVVDGYSHKEISEKLDINEGTSKSQLNRARKVLQNKLTELKATEQLNMVKI